MQQGRFLEKIKDIINKNGNEEVVQLASMEVKEILKKSKDCFCTYYDGFGVVDDTIVIYSGQSKRIFIPSVIQGHPIRRIGAAAFENLTFINRVEIEEGIEEIGTAAFQICTKLREVILPSSIKKIEGNAWAYSFGLPSFMIYKRMNQLEYEQLRNESIVLRDGNYLVTRDYFKNTVYEEVLKENTYNPPAVLGKYMKNLFYKTGDSWKVLRFRGSPEIKTEREGVIFQMNHPLDEMSYPATDHSNDVRKRGWMRCLNIDILTRISLIDNQQIKKQQDEYFVPIKMFAAQVYYQSVQKVLVNKKDFYVYRRRYLTNQKECAFVEEEIEIYTKEGILTNARERSLVWRKYDLLTMIE